MTRKEFGSRLKGFIKRNIPAMAVSFCMILALSLVTVVAVSRTKNNSNIIDQPGDEVPVNTPGDDSGDPGLPVETKPIVFTVPVANATEGMPYAPNYLVEFKNINKWQTNHGITFVAIAGTKVMAAFDGKIEEVYTDAHEGTVVVIDHGDELKTKYMSLSTDVAVKVGDEVKKGDHIGYVSASGKTRAHLGAHLHFEVWLKGKDVNPADYLPGTEK